MGHNTSDYLAIAVARNEPALERLKFHGDFRTIKVDGPVGDYLVSTLRRQT
jgi:hypothetical protein